MCVSVTFFIQKLSLCKEDDEITYFTGTYEYEEVHYSDNNKKKIALYSFDVEYKDGYYTLTYAGV